MSERIHATAVGAPVPDLRTSPVLEETDEDYETAARSAPEDAVCYFNNALYRAGEYVCSGDELLHCFGGVWVREGSCDPDNP
jgi:hypothetical protein